MLALLWAALPVVHGAEARFLLTDGWEFHRGSLGSVWEIWRGNKASDNVTWTPVTLPHCFNSRDAVDPDTHYYQGSGWYRTWIKTTKPLPGRRTLLHFGGAGQRSEVFIGLEKVAEHLGGYDEWTVDITDAMARVRADKRFWGRVPLAVLCDNSRDAESIPSDLSDFVRYGGLYRQVALEEVPAVSLDRLFIAPELRGDGRALVTVRGRLHNPADVPDELRLDIKVFGPDGKPVHSLSRKLPPWTGVEEITTFEIPAPQLWSPGAPALYTLDAMLTSGGGTQELTNRFGVRSVEWIENGPFKLNGERLLLRGTHYHEDHAGVGAAVPDEVVRQTFRQIKEMGANFVRLGHYQQSALVLDLCDELGLLVWEEIPWCRGGLGGGRYKQQARDMLRNLIEQHFNHPSVILWGLGNENDWPGDFPEFDKKAIRGFMKELNGLAHRLDPSRQTCIRRCDFCKDIVDVYSPSIWAGWYAGRYTEYRTAAERAIAGTPRFFHAEWGGDSHAGRHSEQPEKFIARVETGQGTAEVGNAYKSGSGGVARASKDGDWSESYMINLFDWHLKEMEQMPQLTGAAQWVFKDFATPLRPENPVPRVNQKGLVARDGTPKESYYLFQSYWSERPMLHIYGHTWPVRWGKPAEEKLVKVFSNCTEVELFVNGVSAGVKRRDVTDYPAAGLHWSVRFKEGSNKLRAVTRGGSGLTDEIGFFYQTAEWSAPAAFGLREISRANGVATVEVRAIDADGVFCPDAANPVRFGLTGDGRLLDNLGTVGGSRSVQLANGTARIDVGLTGGKAVVSVAGDGFETRFLELTHRPQNLSK